ncbi:siderophore-iron reductase FhuF [Agrobacterium sp. Ap1]|uniref:siderophore-iron reductase FhuF n=1 Tax=Rhizobium/Agrobacterium group TaxID=227290 RepID=UPI001A903A71|nr:siderophore-iron reductase FhuF [Agrobacterium sp. Ap1]MBO0145254.1 siderophore-iron reductase FhuF [Agrobacterium sp. Ap1]
MIAEYSQLFSGALTETGDRLCLHDGRDGIIACKLLLDDRRMAEILETFSGNYVEPDPRAVASQWSKQYFSHLLMPTLAINLVLDRALPVRLDEVGVALMDDARPKSFFFDHAGSPIDAADFSDRFGNLIDGHVAPLVASISKASTLPQKVLWANVGNIVENVVGHCARLAGETPSVRHGREMLASRLWNDGRRNLLFEPIRYERANGQQIRKRKVCCLRYLSASLKLCGTCPLEEVPPRKPMRDTSQKQHV